MQFFSLPEIETVLEFTGIYKSWCVLSLCTNSQGSGIHFRAPEGSICILQYNPNCQWHECHDWLIDILT